MAEEKKQRVIDEGLSRRGFLGVAGSAIALGSAPFAATAQFRLRSIQMFPDGVQSQTMPALPYADSALAPVITANTIGFHYGKHTKAYYDNLAKLVVGTDFVGQPLETIVERTMRRPDQLSIYNNAAQAINHTFYFAGLKPNGGGTPPAELNAAIVASFGSLAEFKAKFLAAATGQFGSGWTWLVRNYDGSLAIISTGNADSPIVGFPPLVPLLTVDVWEHAYYLDYQNLRAKYVTSVLDSLVNWDFVAGNLARAKAMFQR